MYSLNLLPAERKKSLVFVTRLQQWRAAIALAVLGATIAGGLTFAMDWLLADAVRSSERKLTTWRELSAKRQSGRVTTLTREVNQTTAGLDALFGPLSLNRASMVQVLDALPNDIQVTEAKFLVDGQFTLIGIAATRTSFLALRTALDQSPGISSVTTSNTANQRENLPFEYTGQLSVLP